MRIARFVALGLVSMPLACAHEPGSPPPSTPPSYPPGNPSAPAPPSSAPREPGESGQASYYGNSLAGHRTANGERYDPRAFTAAHRKLPFGTMVRVTRADDGRSVIVRVNDRGPFGNQRRIIDLSRAAAETLGMIRAGVVSVHLEVVEPGPAER